MVLQRVASLNYRSTVGADLPRWFPFDFGSNPASYVRRVRDFDAGFLHSVRHWPPYVWLGILFGGLRIALVQL